MNVQMKFKAAYQRAPSPFLDARRCTQNTIVNDFMVGSIGRHVSHRLQLHWMGSRLNASAYRRYTQKKMLNQEDGGYARIERSIGRK